MTEMVVHAMHSMECLGKEQYSKYDNDVLIEMKIAKHKAGMKNQLPLFKRRHFTTTNSRAKQLFPNEEWLQSRQSDWMNCFHTKTIRGCQYYQCMDNFD